MTTAMMRAPEVSGLKVSGVIMAIAKAARISSGKTVTAMRALRSSEERVGD